MSGQSAGASRRALFAGAGAVGVAGVLTACGGDETPSAGAPPDNTAPATGAANPPISDVIAKKVDIPVGGGKLIAESEVVVTQPTAGQFVGFSAMCTHQACILAKVENGSIMCGCHGSKFSVKDGRVQNGPANKALPKVAIKVEGDDIKFA